MLIVGVASIAWPEGACNPNQVAISSDDFMPGLSALAERTLEAFGGVHVLCNNAGVFAGGLSWEAPLSDYEWIFGVNVWGVLHGIRAFILAPVALTRLTDDLPMFQDEKLKASMNPELVSPLVVYLVSDLSRDRTGTTFFVGGGRIAEMKVVTHTGVTKSEDGGVWTPEEIAEKMKPGEILLPG